MSIDPFLVLRELIRQVSDASKSHNCPEYEIVTFITSPMYRLWCRGLGESLKDNPPIYGSHVQVLRRKGYASFSVHQSALK